MSEQFISFRREKVALKTVLSDTKVLHDGSAVAIVSGAHAVRFARVTGEGELDYGPDGVPPMEPFEVRAFNEKAELRWRRPPGAVEGQGIGVLVPADGSNTPEGWADAEPGKADVVCRRSGDGERYLLWGEVRQRDAGGWVSVFEARIRPFFVPVASAAPGNRLCLRYEEILAVDDEYGNVTVRAERLVGLEPLLELDGAESASSAAERAVEVSP